MRLKQREYLDLPGKYIRMERPATAEEQECGLPSLIGLETTVTEVGFLDDGGVRIRGDSFDFTLPLDEADAWKFIVSPDEDERRRDRKIADLWSNPPSSLTHTAIRQMFPELADALDELGRPS